jgi:hypothetical protein
MKSSTQLFATILIAIVLFTTACNENYKPSNESKSIVTIEDATATSAMPLQKDEANRVTIKTADVNINVQNVQQEVASCNKK